MIFRLLLATGFFMGFLLGSQAQSNSGVSAKGTLIIGAPSAPPVLELSAPRYEDQDGNGQIDASEKGFIYFQLLNTGKGDAVGLRLQTKNLAQTKELKFPAQKVLGTLKAGESKSFSFELQAGKNLPEGLAKLEMQVKEANGFDSDPVRINIRTQKFLHPRIAIVDHAFSSEGGQARLGTTIKLTVLVQNTGEGEAKSVKLDFQLPGKVFPSGDLHYTFGNLAPGQSQAIDFGFFPNMRFAGEKITIGTTLSESYGLYGQQKDFAVELEKSLPNIPEVNVNPKEQEVFFSRASLPPENKVLCSDNFDFTSNLPKSSSKNTSAFAVLIGNRNYPNTIGNVDYAESDVNRMRQYLVDYLGYQAGNIKVLENATLGELNQWFGRGGDASISQLNNMISNPEEADILVFYSGHGIPSKREDDKGKSYLLPVDGNANSPEATGYALEDLYKCLKAIPARSKTVILDACFSGAPIKATVSGAAIKPKNPALTDSNLVVLSASSDKQYAHWYPSKGHGMFTYFFFKALHDWERTDADKDKKLTVKEIHAYIANEQNGLPYYVRCFYNNSRKQQPKILGPNKDHVLVSFR